MSGSTNTPITELVPAHEVTVKESLSDQAVESLAAVLRVLADPTRIRLIEALDAGGRATVTSLTVRLPISQQSVSRQLGVLHNAGIVARRREGVWVRYELCDWTGPWVLRQLAAGLGGDSLSGS
ncbi:MAG TPA: metalloregulator ArsR/SmtB family transcription factor [Solirubrobacterales bacterium]|jgi:DNA-binding transcriptional ArsR family regulator|nr:metalloregulator ArsR/SmtB family transcription factor [Solirubrobacterales bacterium]